MWVVDGPSDSRALERKIGGWNLYRKGKKDVLPETWLILSSFPWPFWKHSTPFCPQVLNPRIQVLNSISTNKVFVLNGSQSFHVNNLFYICWTSILHNYLFRHNINVCVVFGLLTTINFFHNKLEILRIFSQKYMITRSLSALLENFIKIFLSSYIETDDVEISIHFYRNLLSILYNTNYIIGLYYSIPIHWRHYD